MSTRTIRNAGTICAAAVITMAVAPGMAQAATASCYVGTFSSSCSSGVINANPTDHNLYYSVRGGFPCARADFQIIDAANGAVVKYRHVGNGVASGWVPGPGDNPGGLYGRYYLRVYNSCADGGGKIQN